MAPYLGGLARRDHPAMQLLTSDGHHHVEPRSAWPLAGLQREQRQAPQRQVQLVDGPGGRIRRASYADLYRGNPWVSTAVTRNARSLARLPLRVYEVTEDGSSQRIRDDVPSNGAPSSGAKLSRILRRPNPHTSGFRLRESAVADLYTYGNGLLAKGRDTSGRVDALYHVPWARVQVILGEDAPILAYEVLSNGAGPAKVLHPDDVVHLRMASDPESPLGLSPLYALADSCGLMDAIRRFLLAYFRNQARPSGNLKLPPGADEAVLEYVREQIEDLYSSPENAGTPMVTTGDWQALTTEPEHTEAVDLYKLARTEVAAAIGIPEPLLGALDHATLANVESLKDYYYTDLLAPVAEGIEADLDSQLLAPSGGWRRLYVRHAVDAATRPNMAKRADAMRSLRYVHTTNELRASEDLPLLDDPRADTVWLPGAEVPLIPETMHKHEEPAEVPSDPEPNPEGSGGPGGDPGDEPEG